MSDLKTKNDKELVKELMDKRASLSSFMFAGAGSKSRNVKEGKNLKKEVARIMTELTARKAK